MAHAHGSPRDGATIDWLLTGDPAIRWHTMRDLQGRSAEEWRVERSKVPHEGWGARFLASLKDDGTWPEGRWTGTVWTLLTLIDLGFEVECTPVRRAAHRFLELNLADHAHDERWLLNRMDLCHLGFWLRIGATFEWDMVLLASLAKTVMSVQFPDGGWNCRFRRVPSTKHGSFHTTFNVLEGLAAAVDKDVIDPEEFRVREAKALEFMISHRMYRSDKTGEIISGRFTHLSFPHQWHYTVLRGLDYIRSRPEIADPRLGDPVAMIEGRRLGNSRWPVEKRIPGDTIFDMERMGGDSRWNTLRVLRVSAARERARLLA